MASLLVKTTLALALALPAQAQQQVPETPFLAPAQSEDPSRPADLRLSDLMDQSIFASEAPMEDASQPPEDLMKIGTISDVMIGRDGRVTGIMIEIGGIFGIGARSVAVPMDRLTFLPDPDSAGDILIALTARRVAIENAPSFDPEDQEAGSAAPGSDQTPPASSQP